MSAICIWKQMDMWEICIKEFYEKWLSDHWREKTAILDKMHHSSILFFAVRFWK